MPAITRINDQKRYDELLNARRTSVIEAAKLVYQTKQWIAKKESELRPISEFKLKMESQVTAGTRLASEVQAIVTQHEDRIEKLNEFKRMLVHFQQNIQEYNTLQHPVELRWYSDVYCYCPHAMVSFDNKFLSRWYYQQGCDVSGSCFYESLKNESMMAKSDTFSREGLAVAGIMLGGILLFTGEILGIMVNPLFFILMIVGIALMVCSITARDNPHPPCDAVNYIEHEAPAVSDDELAHILRTGREMLPENAIFSEASAFPPTFYGIRHSNSDGGVDDNVITYGSNT